jgi:hypothetical protein
MKGSKKMTEVYIKYNPYRLSTELKINGNPLSNESCIANDIEGKRLQKWIGDLPKKLRDERNTRELKVKFHGNKLDYDDVEDAFENAKNKDIISKYELEYEEAKGDDEVYNKIKQTYDDLMEDEYFTGSLSKSDREGLEGAIRRVEDNVFPIHVIATMSSGKSTLINALLQKKLMPSKNEACTAIITEILDNDRSSYSAIVYDKNDNKIKTVEQVTYEVMNNLNDNENIAKVSIDGDIPFLDINETMLKLVDTPGPNNSRNANHRETTYRNINSATENMILYILNYTQLATTDDEILLSSVAEEIKKGGKETRDKFLFVVNKMDAVNEDDSVPHAIEITREYLSKHGIEDPQIFLCSAYVALGLRTTEKDFNKVTKDAMAMIELMKKPNEQKLLASMMQLNQNEDLHLEKYSTLPPSEQEKLNNKLREAEEKGDLVEQALIHSGIYSIESAVRAYVKKYAKAKKIHDFVEPLEAQLNQIEKETKSKITALSGGKEAKEIEERSKAIKEYIGKGEEARKFKNQIDKIDPIPEIEAETKKFINKANQDLTLRFKHQRDKKIEGREKVMQFVNGFAEDSAEIQSNLAVQLEVMINKEINETCTKLVESYQKKLADFDKSVGSSLDFGTSDLVGGVLSRMKENANGYKASGKMQNDLQKTVDSIHKDEKEEYTETVIKNVKTKKTIQDGVKQIKTGEERVVVGHHQEKVGSHKVKKSGLFNSIKSWFGAESAYEEVDDFEWFDDVEYRPTYEYVPNMKEIIEEIPTAVDEKRTRTKYVVDLTELQRKLTTPIREQLDKESKELIKEAKKYMEKLKAEFRSSFDEIDNIVKQKYSELEEYSKKGDKLDKMKKECEEKLDFIQDNLNELSQAVDI